MTALFANKITWQERERLIKIARQRIADREAKQREADARRKAARKKAK